LWLQFAGGVAVYYWVNYSSRLGGYLLAGFLALVVAACLVLRPVGRWEFRLFVHGGVYALILMGLHRFDGALARSAILKPIDFCGKMCYSMYLVHWPIVKLISNVLYLRGVRSVWETLLITVPLTTSVSILAAWIFYLLVERLFLNAPSALASQRQTNVNIEETKQKSPAVVVSAEVETNGVSAIPEIVPAP
jgi:peptidoglycan/LPS O-acetylase OafA/YrhL